MNDPYYILGIPTNASDDEIKQAYRKLAKKYHPDANPGDKAAEKKMQEINAAYDEIMKRRTDPNYGSYGSYDPYGFDPRSSTQQESGNHYYAAARNYISFGRNQEALNVLNSIPSHERLAEWYYLSAVAHSQMGDKVQALSHIRTAVNMEPGNMEYRSFLERLQNPGQTYSTRAGNYQTIQMDGVGSWCCRLCLINLIINFCCCRGC